MKVLTQAQHYARIVKSLRTGEPIRIDPAVDHFCDPLPEERISRILARIYHGIENPDCVSVSWPCQVKAADYVNTHGMIAAMDECLRLDPTALD